jgi:GNAT superfamily N-acetyltransferase
VVIVHKADRPDLIEAGVDMAWAEWGSGSFPEGRDEWVETSRGDRHRDRVPAGFYAIGDDGSLLGSVSLHEFDIGSRRDRTPWLCGLIVRPHLRGRGIGRQLVRRVERFAVEIGTSRIWVFTERAAPFYRSCGWKDVECLSREPDHGAGTVLMRSLPAGGAPTSSDQGRICPPA